MKIAPEKGVLGNAILLYALTVLVAVLLYFSFGHMIIIDLQLNLRTSLKNVNLLLRDITG